MPSPRKPNDRRQNRITSDIEVVAGDSELVIPDPPSGLLQRSNKVWEGFWKSAVSRVVDLESDLYRIERYIWWVDQFERTRKDFAKKKGYEDIGSTGQKTLSTQAKWIQVCEKQIRAAESELGLTPKARAQLGIAIQTLAKSVHDLNKELDEVDDVSLDDALDDTESDDALEGEFVELDDGE